MTPDIRAATADDAPDCVAILSDWIEETPWMPRLHSDGSMITFWRDRLATASGWVAMHDDRPCGFGVRDGNSLTALYVTPASRRNGTGRALLDRAKAGQPMLRLWVFEANEPAQAFYAHQGFAEVQRTPGDNEEAMPDIEMIWRR